MPKTRVGLFEKRMLTAPASFEATSAMRFPKLDFDVDLRESVTRICGFGSLLLIVGMLFLSTPSFAQVGVSVRIAPPPLPVYEQPVCPGDGYIWTPGYWAWDNDYYWVPGTWMMPPEVGFLWTPGYWGWGGDGFLFNEGYWGLSVGFYGGIDYGFGYFGHGYEGGRWQNGHFFGVTANVITDANGARLAIVSNTSGSAANFTVTAGTGGLGFSQAVNGANASVTVDGITLSSASNTVTGALPGVTLNLLNAAPGTSVSLAVAPDTSQASTAINQFVTDYNKAIGDVNTQFTDSGSGEGVLAGDSVVRSLQSTLQQALDYMYTPSSGTTTVPTLTSLGISVNQDGTLSVDSSTLNSVLQNNFSDVQNFFQGPALNGFANSLDQQLTSFISPADGAFTVDLQSISTEYSGLQTDITNFQNNYIAPLQTQLTAEYSQAEILLQQLPEEMQQINTELGLNNNSSSGG